MILPAEFVSQAATAWPFDSSKGTEWPEAADVERQPRDLRGTTGALCGRTEVREASVAEEERDVRGRRGRRIAEPPAGWLDRERARGRLAVVHLGRCCPAESLMRAVVGVVDEGAMDVAPDVFDTEVVCRHDPEDRLHRAPEALNPGVGSVVVGRGVAGFEAMGVRHLTERVSGELPALVDDEVLGPSEDADGVVEEGGHLRSGRPSLEEHVAERHA